MSIFSIEHSIASYRADFLFYLVAVSLLAGFVALSAPPGLAPLMAALAIAGLVLWSALEYGLHRFVLHGVEPFASWHREHHQRPRALVGAPTVLSASLLGGLVLLPAWWLMGGLNSSALALGVLTGYLGYTLTHHAVHHGFSQRAPNFDWLRHQTQWHARHHHLAQPRCFGVTTRVWDHVLGTSGHRP